MAALSRKALRLIKLGCVAVGTVVPLLIALSLFLDVAMQKASRAGIILRMGLGIALILSSMLVLGYWVASSRSSDRHEDSTSSHVP